MHALHTHTLFTHVRHLMQRNKSWVFLVIYLLNAALCWIFGLLQYGNTFMPFGTHCSFQLQCLLPRTFFSDKSSSSQMTCHLFPLVDPFNHSSMRAHIHTHSHTKWESKWFSKCFSFCYLSSKMSLMGTHIWSVSREFVGDYWFVLFYCSHRVSVIAFHMAIWGDWNKLNMFRPCFCINHWNNL